MKHYTTRTTVTGLTSHVKGTTLCTQLQDVTIYDILKGNIALPSDNGTNWPTSDEVDYLRYLKSQMSLSDLMEAAASAKDSEAAREEELRERYLDWLDKQAKEEAAASSSESSTGAGSKSSTGAGSKSSTGAGSKSSTVESQQE